MLNWAQNTLFDNLWYLNVILKARQLGVTTFFCILYLDDVIFNGLDSGLIAHTLQDATKIFDTKVKYAWDNLPQAIKSWYTVDSDNVRELKFTKGNRTSSIYVGTSLRSGTVQRLHVSEMGTIDQKYPQKSEEIKSGALNTVHRGQIVTIESTAKGQTGVFYDVCSEGLTNDKMGKELSPMDWKFFFFPWWMHPEYKLEGQFIIPRETQEYFEHLRIAENIELNQEQKNWYYKKSLTQKDSMKGEFPSVPAEAFLLNIEGSYYGKQIDRAMETKRIGHVPYDPRIPVDTWWDLGTNLKKTDATAIIFSQTVGLEVRIIDYYGSSGEGLAHYIKTLQDKIYVYGRHWAPHDIEVTELGTGKTRKEMAAELGLRFDVVPMIPFADGIEATRMILGKTWIDEEKCSHLIKALKSYRKEWDDKLGKFKDKPLKDWAADPADALRMLAVGHKDHRTLGFLDPEEEEMRKIKEHQERVLNPFDPFN